MHPRSLLIVAVAMAASLACSGLLALSPAATEGLEDAAWAGYGLPLDDGTVVRAESDTLTVRFDGHRIDELAPDMSASLEAQGWQLLAAVDRGDSRVFTYHKDGTTLMAALTAARGTTVAQLDRR